MFRLLLQLLHHNGGLPPKVEVTHDGGKVGEQWFVLDGDGDKREQFISGEGGFVGLDLLVNVYSKRSYFIRFTADLILNNLRHMCRRRFPG